MVVTEGGVMYLGSGGGFAVCTAVEGRRREYPEERESREVELGMDDVDLYSYSCASVSIHSERASAPRHH